MKLSLSQAAKEVGVNKSTIFRAIKSGKMSAEFDGNTYAIDPAELFRIFEPAIKKPATSEETGICNNQQQVSAMAAISETVAELRGRVETLSAWNNELRSELSQEREERRKLTMMLTDQRANDAPQVIHVENPSNNWPLVVLVITLVVVSISAFFAVKMGLI